MTNLSKLEFTALDITENNYLSWILDVEMHLNAMNLGTTIKEGNQASLQDHAKALIFIRHHLHEGLKGFKKYNEPIFLSLYNLSHISSIEENLVKKAI